MSAALFALGFLATGIAGAEYLAKHDPEPIGAFASVLLFCVLAAASSVMVYVAIPYKSNRVPGVVASLLSGALSASAKDSPFRGRTALPIWHEWWMSLASFVKSISACMRWTVAIVQFIAVDLWPMAQTKPES